MSYRTTLAISFLNGMVSPLQDHECRKEASRSPNTLDTKVGRASACWTAKFKVFGISNRWSKTAFLYFPLAGTRLGIEGYRVTVTSAPAPVVVAGIPLSSWAFATRT